MIFKYNTQSIDKKVYIVGSVLKDVEGSPSGEYEFSKGFTETLTNENGKLQWVIRENPNYSPETDHIDNRYLIEYDPISPTAEEIEAEHQRKIERQLQTELPELILQNKDSPENLAKVLCDRAKQIEAGTKT